MFLKYGVVARLIFAFLQTKVNVRGFLQIARDLMGVLQIIGQINAAFCARGVGMIVATRSNEQAVLRGEGGEFMVMRTFIEQVVAELDAIQIARFKQKVIVVSQGMCLHQYAAVCVNDVVKFLLVVVKHFGVLQDEIRLYTVDQHVYEFAAFHADLDAKENADTRFCL